MVNSHQWLLLVLVLLAGPVSQVAVGVNQSDTHAVGVELVYSPPGSQFQGGGVNLLVGQPAGCFVWHLEYTDPMVQWCEMQQGFKQHCHQPDPLACQSVCQAQYHQPDPLAAFFTHDISTGLCSCYKADARLSGEKREGAVSGPVQCASPAQACTALPDLTQFPVENASLSDTAWPSLGYQPQEMQCWPRDEKNDLVRCSTLVRTGKLRTTTTFNDVTVLEDVKTGWLGTCAGLLPVQLNGTSCEESCVANVLCSVWTQMYEHDCYQGSGYNCYDFAAAQLPIAGQRLMHGKYRVMREFNDVEILGLRQVFDVDNQQKIVAAGKDPAETCRGICLSVLPCQYWQLVDTGCWIEQQTDTTDMVAYPLTTHDVLAADGKVSAGEFIQRTCPTPASASDGDISGFGIPAWAFMLVLAATAIAIFGCIFMPRKTTKDSRQLDEHDSDETSPVSMNATEADVDSGIDSS